MIGPIWDNRIEKALPKEIPDPGAKASAVSVSSSSSTDVMALEVNTEDEIQMEEARATAAVGSLEKGSREVSETKDKSFKIPQVLKDQGVTEEEWLRLRTLEERKIRDERKNLVKVQIIFECE